MKQDIKQSEARILVYLSVVHFTRKHVTAISNRLEMDYAYTMRVLGSMVAKGWLRKHKHRRFMYYDLTVQSPIELAKKAFQSDDLQQKLKTGIDITADPDKREDEVKSDGTVNGVRE